MKKFAFIFLPFLLISFYTKAQAVAPVVVQLRELLVSAKTNFAADLGKKIQDDAASNSYYETKKTSEAAETVIIHKAASGQNMYMIILSNKADDVPKVILLVDQYMDELNRMIKTGNYIGEDRKDSNGKDITEVKDKAGNIVLRYASDKASQIIYLYGYTTK
ncbi:MAG: hypothetical protein ABIN91_10450 [Mucilaginibacter sp.]|uniref:hypothetical protein n=1 Tax=Mucilaginibacter sp. TaxID=1882438 RepID=UPI00326546B3